MSVGLPSYLATGTVSRAFSRALHVMALVYLTGSALLVLSLQLVRDDGVLWPAAIALALAITALTVLDRNRTTVLAIAYLVLGSVGVYFTTLGITANYELLGITDEQLISFSMTALVLIGGTVGGALAVLSWCAAAFVLAHVAANAARLQLGEPLAFDTLSTTVFVVTALLLFFGWNARRAGDKVQNRLRRAAREEVAFALRHRIEARATALIHDTMLNHLSAVSLATPGGLDPTLREEMERDLAVLVDEEWLTIDHAPTRDESLEWQSSPLFQAIREAGTIGLEVDATGDVGAVMLLDAERAEALGLAVKQCLVNVARHSGKSDAEVTVHAAGDDLFVMVIDAGQGFDVSAIPADRIGLRNSVVSRVESVGGSAQVWSTPGQGTSIMIRMPVEPSARSDESSVAGDSSEARIESRHDDDTDSGGRT